MTFITLAISQCQGQMFANRDFAARRIRVAREDFRAVD
jgi:hypothetical protein